MKILQILSSALAANSVSTKLSNAIVEKLKAANTGSSVIIKDLGAIQPPHLNMNILGALSTPVDARTPEQKLATAFSRESIAEIIDADVIVVGLAFYNFSLPSVLKAWIDHISLARVTFRYDEHGQQIGLLQNKPVYVAIASGGIYRTEPMEAMDFAKNYFALAMKTIGLADTRFFIADGMGVHGYKDTSLQNAIESIDLCYVKKL